MVFSNTSIYTDDEYGERRISGHNELPRLRQLLPCRLRILLALADGHR